MFMLFGFLQLMYFILPFCPGENKYKIKSRKNDSPHTVTRMGLPGMANLLPGKIVNMRLKVNTRLDLPLENVQKLGQLWVISIMGQMIYPFFLLTGSSLMGLFRKAKYVASRGQ